jgi:TolA-binding protein
MRPTMSDDQLDALARGLAPVPPHPDRMEQVRTTLLAAAADVTPLPVVAIRRRTVLAVSVPLVIAAAVVVALVVARRGDELPRSHARLTPGPDAELSQVRTPPDEIVHLRRGSLTIDVAPHPRSERFRVITADAELEAREARFVVAAAHGTLARIEIERGEIELRLHGDRSLTLHAGATWTAPLVETAEATEAPAPVVVDAPAAADPPSASKRRVTKPPAAKSDPEPAVPAPSVSTGSTPASSDPAPGEAEFRTGWEALRAGEPKRAAASFAASYRAAGTGNVAEDARYWEGIALARADRSVEAIASLRRFLSKYPSSARAGEASARLGWLLIDAGELDAAEDAFDAAASDPVPAVRRSATQGRDKVRTLRE